MKEYFSHDYNARSDEKMIKLIMDEGYAGYGVYWALIEMIHENKGYIHNDYKRIAFALHTECERIKDVIELYDLFVIKDGKISNTRVLYNLIKRSEKSEKAKNSAKKRWDSSTKNANAMRTQCDSNAIKVKESKLKERKEKNIKEVSKDTHVKRFDAPDESEKILQIWNNFAQENNLSQIIKLSDKRKSALLARSKEKEFDLQSVLDQIENSDFLLGKNKDWKVSFDFVFCSTNNYLKILEGKYQNKNSKNEVKEWVYAS